MWITAPKNRLLFLASVSLSLLTLSGVLRTAWAQARPPAPEEDTQLWNDLQAAVAVSKEVDFNLYATFRFGRDVTHLVERRVGAGFSFKAGEYLKQPADFLSLSAWYLNIATRPVEGRKGNEQRLHFAATAHFAAGRFGLSDRNLFERRVRFPLSSTRYRNRFQVDYPAKLKDGQFGLFASDEVFYDWSLHDWTRNRFAAGVSHRFNKHFTTDLYYLRQNDSHSRPGDLHVIGLTYRVRL